MRKLLFLAALIFGLTFFGLLFFWHQAQDAPILTPAAEVPYFLTEPAARTEVPVYRYSVVPGGVESLQEFRRYVALSPILRAWMQGFDWDNAHVEQICGAVRMTFKRDGQIHWTARPVALKHCEAVITDGRRAFLMRCGNEISWTPREPAETIDTAELETPALPNLPQIPGEDTVGGDTPVLTGVSTSFTPSIVLDPLLPPGYRGVCATPEPPLLFLLVPGTVALIVLRKRKNATAASNQG